MMVKSKKSENSTTSPNISLGRWGEEIALKFLIDHGLVSLGRNVRTPDGEIDIVAKNGDELVFIEVKTRRSINHSYPEESINDEKLEHIEAAAGWYLLQHPEFEENWRLDVITVIGSPATGIYKVDWFKNVTG